MSQKIKIEIARKIAASQSIAVTSHLRPDGDSIYTSLALGEILDQLGKKVQIVIHDQIPFPFKEFPEVERIRIGQIEPEGVDLVILLECADVSRSGQTGIDHLPKINIDHHYSNSPYAEINWIDPGASAVGEMVYELLEPLQVRLTRRLAEFLYSAIFCDTGSFQFSNTTAKTFAVCHQLVEAGANPNLIADKILNNNTPSKIKLMGRILSTLKLNPAGNIAALALLQKDLKESGLEQVDMEDITTIARSIKGVEIVIFFKEMPSGEFRVSLRSKGEANSALIAEHYGGGGHKHAAGFTVIGDFEKLYPEIIATVESLLSASTEKL